MITNYQKHAATGGEFVSPPWVFTTNTKIAALVIGALLLLAFHTLGGKLVGSVKASGGAALGGFNLLLLPAALLVFGGIARLLGFQLLNRFHYVGSNPEGSTPVIRGVILLFAAAITILSLFAISRSLCGRCSQLPSFGVEDSLKILGHVTWMSLPFLLMITIALAKKENAQNQECERQYFSREAINAYWNGLPLEEREGHLFDMEMAQRAKIYPLLDEHIKAIFLRAMSDPELIAYFNDPNSDIVDAIALQKALPPTVWARIQPQITTLETLQDPEMVCASDMLTTHH